MKNITIAGRLTRDSEIRRTNAGDPILQFSVAVDHFDGRDKSTMFFDCALFGKRGQSLEPHLTKGASVAVSGDFHTFKADNGNVYLKVTADRVSLHGGSQKRDDAPSSGQKGSNSYAAASGRQAPARQPSFAEDMDSDSIPF